MFKPGLTMEGLMRFFLMVGVIVWMLVGVAVLYRFGVLERYQISDGETQYVYVHNSLTGSKWICGILGCINILPDEDPIAAILNSKRMQDLRADDLRKYAREIEEEMKKQKALK